jgi:hypothetical protein
MQLRKTMASTNVIEPAFSIVEQVCKNVKRWHGGDRRERWVGSGLLVAEKQFRRVQGYKQIPALMRELEALTTSKPEVSFAARDGDMPVGVQNVPIHNARVDTASVEYWCRTGFRQAGQRQRQTQQATMLYAGWREPRPGPRHGVR